VTAFEGILARRSYLRLCSG